MTDIAALQSDILAAVQGAADEAALEAVRVGALGKKGSVTALLATMGGLSPDERKLKGPQFNGLKDAVTAAIAARKVALGDAALDARLGLLDQRLVLDQEILAPLVPVIVDRDGLAFDLAHEAGFRAAMLLVEADQVAAEFVIDEADADRPVGIDEVRCETDGAFIDDGSGFGHGFQEIENVRVGLAGVLEDVARIGQQNDEAFCFGALFQRIYFADGFGVGGVAADAPDGIGGIQDQAAGSEDSEAMLDVRIGGHVSDLAAKILSLHST